MTIKKTLNIEEVEKFSRLANQWWNPSGSFKPLHMLNPVRLKYIKETIEQHFNNQNLSSLSILDIGCGGGLVSEPLAKIGFNVTGADASLENIEIAKQHAKDHKIKVNYLCSTAEELTKQKNKFDVVLALEIIEHVDNPEHFVSYLADLCTNNGVVIISTLNKTIKSFLFAIIGAEYITRMLPVGTHQYEKFIEPAQLVKMSQDASLAPLDLKGLKYNPLKKSWSLSDDMNINYFAAFTKN
jgi:2-polyprenyl-6-hydroxyphenyl methylase/3-demethylubiquinone-9 3-methyltransferase